MIAKCTNWYAVHTHVHAEAKAALNLIRQGYVVFFPRYRKRTPHARRTEIVLAPLFPRYLFVLIDMAGQRWRPIESTFGVAYLVCNGDQPSVVSDEVISSLQRREDADGCVRLDASAFAPGAKVRVRHGAFDDSIGLFEGMTDHERVAILLDLLGRKVRVFMDATAIEAA